MDDNHGHLNIPFILTPETASFFQAGTTRKGPKGNPKLNTFNQIRNKNEARLNTSFNRHHHPRRNTLIVLPITTTNALA
jgi:hypothetical protein